MSVRRPAAAAAGLAAAAAIGYAAAAFVCVRGFAARPPEPAGPGDAAPVSLLVPLFGAEEGLAENLHAFVAQDHAQPVQVIFGVHDASDPAFAVATAVRDAFPDRDVVVAAGAPRRTRNPKIANLIGMYGHVRHEHIVLADSDVRVDAAFVRSLTAPLAAADVGAVTCIYAALHRGGLPSRLAAAFVNEQFAPSALVASALGPLRHCYGAAIALRRSVLEEVGGFSALGRHLADDYVLGRLIADRGYRIALSRYVPRTLAGEATWGALWRHELRWHRTIRAVQPRGYAGMFLTYPVPLALAAAALGGSRARGAVLVGLALLVRGALRAAAAKALGVEPTPVALVPLRDFVGLAVWLRGLFGGSVDWRGEQLALAEGDELM